MNTTKIFSVLILFSLVLSLGSLIFPIKTVSAYGLADTIVTLSNPVFGHPQMCSTTLGNGNFLYVYARDSQLNNQLYLYLYNSAGVQQANTVVDLLPNTNNLNDVKAFSVDSISDDVAIISYFIEGFDTNYYQSIGVVLYNTNTYVATVYDITPLDTGVTVPTRFLASQMIQYNNRVYGFFTYKGSPVYCWAYEYDISADTITTNRFTSSNLEGWAFFWGDDRDGYDDQVYILATKSGTDDTPRYLKWDLDTWNTTQPETLADHGVTTDWEYDNKLSKRFVGAGLEYNTTMADYFLHFTWTFDHHDDSSIYVVQNRLRFNASGIDTTYLEAQSRLVEINGVTTGYATSELPIYTGYLSDYDEINVYFCARYDDPDDYRALKNNYRIYDWFDFGSSTINYIEQSWLTQSFVQVEDYDYNIYKDPASEFQFSEKTDESEVLIYYDLATDIVGYSVTYTWLPNDDPHYVNTRYDFTGTILLNYAGTQAPFEVWFDDVIISSQESETDGSFGFRLLTMQRGVHNLTIAVYRSGELQYTTTGTYNFVDLADAGLDGGIGGAFAISTLLYIIPIFGVVFVPAFMLYELGLGTNGLLFGLIVGVVIGTMAGVIPSYVTFLLAMVVIMVFLFRRGSSD